MKISFLNSSEPTNEDILNQGLKYVMEFGSTFGQPIQNRLSKKYQFLSQSQLDVYEKICRDIVNKSCDYVYSKLDILYKNMENISSKQLEDDFRKFVQTQYPLINKSTFKKLLNHAWYFAMHDGLDSVIKQ